MSVSSTLRPSRRCGSWTPLKSNTTTLLRILERVTDWSPGGEKLRSCACPVTDIHNIAKLTVIAFNLVHIYFLLVFTLIDSGSWMLLRATGFIARRELRTSHLSFESSS